MNMMGDTTSFGNMLFDLNEDPTQNTQIHDEAVEMRMKGYIREYMEKNDAPKELYKRLGFTKNKSKDGRNHGERGKL